jgi:AraC-like DNA-binding protein
MELSTDRLARVPHTSLRAVAGSYVGYRSAGGVPGVHLGLPSTRLDITIAFDHPLTLSWVGSTGAPTEHSMVAGGLHMQPVAVHHRGGHHGVQVSLSPSGCRTVLGVPAAALANDFVDLNDVLRVDYDALADASWNERFAMIDAALLNAAARARPTPAWHRELDYVWSLLVQTHGAVRVHECAAAVGWSRRRLLERFKSEFGITPKEAARACRFEASRRMLERGESLVATAMACGYADQPHLNREWRALAGSSPLQRRRGNPDG